MGVSIKIWAIIYLSTIGAFLILDGLWLGLIAKSFYASQLGDLMAKPIRVLPAGIFYLMYAVGLVVIAIRPGDVTVGLAEAAAMGALVGFLAYGTYDMTNLSTIEGWPLKMSLVDWAWGTFVTGFACGVGAWAKLILIE